MELPNGDGQCAGTNSTHTQLLLVIHLKLFFRGWEICYEIGYLLRKSALTNNTQTAQKENNGDNKGVSIH